MQVQRKLLRILRVKAAVVQTEKAGVAESGRCGQWLIASLLGLMMTSGHAGPLAESKVINPVAGDAPWVAQVKSTVTATNRVLGGDGKTSSPRIVLFARLADPAKTKKAGYLVGGDKVVKVRDAKSWPELTITSYIVVLRPNGAVAALQEVPVSESGDWNNGYTHYFDETGQTIAFERNSSFFNACDELTPPLDENSVTTETSTYYYRNGKLIAKDYSFEGVINKKTRPINSAKCTFHYRHPYKIYPQWEQVRKAVGITLDAQAKS